MARYRLWVITAPYQGVPVYTYFGAYDSIGDCALAQLYKEDVDPEDVEWWDEENDTALQCVCTEPLLKEVFITTDYGSCRVWKGEMCGRCLYIVKGLSAFGEDIGG